MQFAPPDRPPILHQMIQAPALSSTGNDAGLDWFDDRFDVTQRSIQGKLEVGPTAYPLLSPLSGSFYRGKAGEDGEFIVWEFGNDFVGRGKNADIAYLDWRDKIHSRFQELYAMRPFEMTDSDKQMWKLFENRFDVALYRNTTPLTFRMVGKVGRRMRPNPELIEWEDGSTEKVGLDQMPGEFARYKPGQPFEAVVARDPVDFQLLQVFHIRRLSQLPKLNDERFRNLLESIPTTETLPQTDWE